VPSGEPKSARTPERRATGVEGTRLRQRQPTRKWSTGALRPIGRWEAGADGLYLSGEGATVRVDLAPDDLRPGLSVYTAVPAYGHRWVVPADPPTESSAAPVIVILQQQPQQSVERPRHHRHGDLLWKQRCRAYGRYPSACLPSAYGRHHQRQHRQHVRPAALPARPAWPTGVPAGPGRER